MSTQSLEALLSGVGNIAQFLRNQQSGPNVYPGVPAEYTNWRDEQQAWQKTCVLFNQSFHMAELLVEGPGAFALLNRLGINSFKGFVPGKAKQFVPCTPDGYVIGDVILFYLDDESFNLVGRAPTLNWVMYNAEVGGDDVKLTYDERSAARPDPFGRVNYRYQIQGPNAAKVIEAATGAPAPDLKFFNMCWMEIAGKKVRALRHGMAGAPGLEVWGPYEQVDEIKNAIMEAGKDFGIVAVGARAYATNTLESGWIPSPVPAIYTGDKLKAYREWLPLASYEANASIGGSFVSKNIEDYYTTPYELGYNGFTKFDHDFIGADALKAMEGRNKRKKVTFAWENKDVERIWASQLAPAGENYKFIDLPLSNYASSSYDAVMKGGKRAGASMFSGYSFNERKMLSLGWVEEEFSKPGTELSLVWGEENGGTKKTTVERHKQTEVKVIVSPAPYSAVVREGYEGKWRQQAAE